MAEVVASVKRYFDGEEADFSDVELDLGSKEPFARQIYEAARRVRAKSVRRWHAIRWP